MTLPRSLVLDRIADRFEVGDGCWLWTSTIAPTGYGVIKIKQQQFRAHCLVYELLVGPIPEGLHIDHLCRIRHCVNPGHLEPVTPAENNRRTKGHRGRKPAARDCTWCGIRFSPIGIRPHSRKCCSRACALDVQHEAARQARRRLLTLNPRTAES